MSFILHHSIHLQSQELCFMIRVRLDIIVLNSNEKYTWPLVKSLDENEEWSKQMVVNWRILKDFHRVDFDRNLNCIHEKSSMNGNQVKLIHSSRNELCPVLSL